MPAIASIDASAAGPFTAPITTLTASDTITFRPNKKQLLVVRNPTGGSLTLNIDGDAGTTVTVPGLGSVSVASGLNIAIPTLESRAVVLSTVSAYCQGTVTLTGAATAFAQLFDL